MNNKQTPVLATAFAHEYIQHWDVGLAGAAVGMCRNTAYKYINTPEVKAALAKISAKAVQKYEVTVDRVVKELSAIAFRDPKDIYDEFGELKPLSEMPEAARRAIAGIEKTVENTPVGIRTKTKVTFDSKNQALTSLGRFLKMFIDRVEIEIDVAPSASIKSLEERIESMKKTREVDVEQPE